jgi:hypothetical protein
MEKHISYRQYKKINITNFMHNINSSPLGSIGNVNQNNTKDELCEIITTYNNTLSDAINTHAPLKEKLVIIRREVPWMTEEIKRDKKERRMAERKWRQCTSNERAQFRDIFKQKRNACRIRINKAKQEYYSSKVLNCKGDQKKLFTIIKTLSKPLSDIEYPDYTSPNELANNFGDYFALKIIKIRKELDDLNIQAVRRPQNAYASDLKLTTFEELSDEEVRKLIIKSPNKQSSTDPLPTWLLKDCMESLLPALKLMLNMSLRIGYFPEYWTDAIVTPLLKKMGIELIYPNYRPVSNLTFVSKLVERASASQLTYHMQEKHPLPKYQSAYRTFHSTETALLKVQSDLLLNMDKQRLTLLVMLDLSAAFDTIDHQIMLDTLKYDAGVDGIALQWFESYLTNRTHQISVKGARSKEYKIIHGVPQGSCLGPILFTIYAASLFKVIKRHLVEAHGYADDHQLYVSFEADNPGDEEITLKMMEDCIKDVRQWMLANKLKIN